MAKQRKASPEVVTAVSPPGSLEVARNAVRPAPRSRFTPQVECGMRLEERDQRILCDLFLHRLMSRGQLERCYFSSTVRCNARLRQLFDHRFVARHYPPYAPFGSQAIYSAGKAALPLIARRLDMDLPDVIRSHQRSKTPTFIEHTLAVVDIWLAFQEAIQTAQDQDGDGIKKVGIEIERWLAETQCRHEWDIRIPGGSWRKEAFKPDGFVRLQTPEGYRHFFIEADLGHTSSRQFLGKLLTHQRYLDSGLFEQTYGDASGESNFRTLVFTTGARRLGNLMALAAEQQNELFWFTTLEQNAIAGPLQTIWSSPFSSRPFALLEESGRVSPA